MVSRAIKAFVPGDWGVPLSVGGNASLPLTDYCGIDFLYDATVIFRLTQSLAGPDKYELRLDREHGGKKSIWRVKESNVFQISTPLEVLADVRIASPGRGFQIKEGSNAKAGLGTLASGSVFVRTTRVSAESRIAIFPQSIGNSESLGTLRVGRIECGVGFVINSHRQNLEIESGDRSSVYWQIWDPS